MNRMVSPILKWAGGKRQLVPELMALLPESWNVYFEPFVGGGAVLTALYSGNMITSAFVSDINTELINFYTVVRDSFDDFVSMLKGTEKKNSRPEYDRIRADFNGIRGKPEKAIQRAVLFMYLNRHGYNGLWRVNRKGEYNVPFGRYENPSYPDLQKLESFSSMLADLKLVNSDFRKAVTGAGKHDLVYFDPPYMPESSTAYFTDYTELGFSPGDQEDLANVCRELNSKGARFILSNSDTPAIRKLYEGFNVRTVSVNRAINSRGDRRKGQKEIIVTNY